MITDTQLFTTKDSSPEERKRLNVGDIWANQVKCLSCGDIIRSKNRHDFVRCSCGKIAVDGGSWYQRRVGDLNSYEELSEDYNNLDK